MKWLVTGGTGFVGRRLCSHLVAGGASVTAMTRRFDTAATVCLPAVRWWEVPELAGAEFPNDVFHDVDVVVHLAARVHIRDQDPLTQAAFQRANVEATLRLAEQAQASGVRRFVFLSTVKVLGDSTPVGHPFGICSEPAPEDEYAVSKADAERGLMKIADQTGLEVVVIRAPLVYGAGVKGNFRSLMDWVRSGLPIPLAGIRNSRSLVALDNLVDLIEQCGTHPSAANQTFLVSDDEDISTPELIRHIADAMGRPSGLFSVPVPVLAGLARLAGRSGEINRLTGNLQVDITETRHHLGWRPSISLHEGVLDAVRGLDVAR
jgi:nucleoside-diphosphate-sugar epimerase